MNRTLYEKWLKTRKEVLGEEYVTQALAQADDFSLPIQEFSTQYLLGRCEVFTELGL